MSTPTEKPDPDSRSSRRKAFERALVSLAGPAAVTVAIRSGALHRLSRVSPVATAYHESGHALGAYPEYKSARGLQPIRDWTLRGRTLRSMAVISASPNACTIGFTDAQADLIAHVNNQRERAFGVSPKDREKLVAAVRATAAGGGIIVAKVA